MTGYFDAQITRLIKKKKKFGKVFLDKTTRHKFPKIYLPEDIGLLSKTDEAHSRLSGPATKRIFERECDVFKKSEFARLKKISVSHIYNLRGIRQYCSNARFFVRTKPTKVAIGKRQKPDPQGEPGYLRVDSVH